MIHTLPNCIENSARLFPNKEAFRCGKTSLSFQELDIKTNQLAKHLVDSGIQKGDRIGIYMNRCIETSIAIYGILKAGAVYVPIDPISPRTRTKFLIENCGIQFLITVPKQKKRAAKLLVEDISLKQVIGFSDDSDIKHFSWESIFSITLESYQRVNILSEDMAYIIFTSGSTGDPKGIMHTHKSGLAYAQLSASLYKLRPQDRVANHAPLHFDISTFGYFSAPYAGATTVIIPDAPISLPVSLGALIAEEKISIWYSVPLALSQLLLSGVLDQHDYSAIRWVLFAGENFTLKYLKGIMEKWPQAKYSNVYGPTEVNQCTFYNFNAKEIFKDYVPIGDVWDNTEYKIIDEDDKEVHKGETGQLLIRSSTMMLGYWNNKELTEKSIYKQQISNNLEQVYYRTGDLVRQDNLDRLVFLGRKDRQVKVRGYRIELDEIEAVLNDHPSIKECTVCVLEKDNDQKILTAAIILTLGASTETNELITHCRSKLPTYAVPQRIDVLKNFPRTSSGKIDLTQIRKTLISQ